MKHLTIRLRITWLTLVAGLMFGVLALLSPGFSQIDAHYARGLEELRDAMHFPDRSDLFDGFRGSLAGDMVFLLAFGFLLRASARWHDRQTAARAAGALTLVLMACDSIENLSMLKLLSMLVEPSPASGPVPSPFLVVVTNVASIGKWLTAGAVGVLLGYQWWRHCTRYIDRDRVLAIGIAVLFILGGGASLVVAILFPFPDARIARVDEVTQATWLLFVAQNVALGAPALALLGQLALLGLPGLLLRFLVLCRVPFGVMLAVVAFGPIAFGSQKALLGGVLQLTKSHLLAQVTATSLLVTLAAGVQVNLVRAYATKRFDDEGLRYLGHRRLRTLVFWTTLVGGLSLPLCALVASRELGILSVFAVILGAIGALALAAAVELLAAFCSDPLTAGEMPQCVIPSLRIRPLTSWLQQIQLRPRPQALNAVARGGNWFTREVFGPRGGFGYAGQANGRTFLMPGHTLAILLFIATFIFYAAVVWTKLSNSATVGGTTVPTLTAIMLLILLAGWAFGALTFFLDRYRVPLLAGLLGLAMATGSLTRTDHVFAVEENENRYTELTPGQVLEQFTSRRPIVIAAAGGGIQAGAWAAQVMQGLDNTELLNGALRDRVALVSGVSGGSMGALYFGAYHEDGSLANARRLAAQSSLDNVATAFVGLDVWRVLGRPLLALPTHDRGWALEETWRQRARQQSSALTLRDWAQKAGRVGQTGHPFPAFLFNSTVVETGQPVAFATTQFPSSQFRAAYEAVPNRHLVVESFNELYELYDRGSAPAGAHDVGLSVPTAARLSSAFPYVSPAAAPAWKEPKKHKNYHLVDGGYYDNYGLIGLAQWLDDALTELKRRGKLPPTLPVTVVMIRDQDDRKPDRVDQWGWLTQLSAPPSAFLATRAYGHWAGGRAALKLLQEKWVADNVSIRDVAFVYPLQELRKRRPECSVPPLSWLLTNIEDRCIGFAWDASDEAIDQFIEIEGLEPTAVRPTTGIESPELPQTKP